MICNLNDVRFIGQSNNVSQRLSAHRYLLKEGPDSKSGGDSPLLQADFDKYREQKGAFDFVVLYQGPEWALESDRTAKETELIRYFKSQGLSYNLIESASRYGSENSFHNREHTEKAKKAIGDKQRGIPKDKLGKKVSIDGKTYNSLSDANSKTGEARKTIRDRCNDPANPNYKFVV